MGWYKGYIEVNDMTGEELKAHLAAHGLSQRKAADELLVNIRTITRYCASVQPIPRIAEYAIRWVIELRSRSRLAVAPSGAAVVPEVMQVLADDEPYDDSDAVCQRCDVPCMYDDERVVVAGGASYAFCVKCYPGAVQWMAEMAAARAASGQLTGPVATNGAVLQ
jgi:hypothetical protein